LDVNLGSQFNRKCFEISFDYFISATDKDSARNGNIITFDSSYRALGLIMKDGSIFVTTNNVSKYFDAGIRYKKEKWEHINLILIDGDLVINSKLIKVGDITWSPSNNILSSRNFGNGQAFKGQFRNLVVKTKSTLSIFDKKENIICDGTYNPTSIGQSSGKALNMNLGDQFNRNNFEMSFEFYPEAMSGRNDNILTLDTSYRSFGLIMLNDNICVTTNNQRNRFNTDIQVTCNAWNSVNLVYDDGHLTINGKSFQIGNLSEGRNNVISSMNFSNGHAFKGQIKNLVVRSK
jgi:hypothetical protein